MAWLGDIEDEIGHSEFRVLFRLCWHCNERDLLCCPSIEELVRGAGMSRSSVLRALKELEARSFITVDRERWDNGTQKNNRYTILADVVITMPNGRKVDLSPTAEQRANRVSPAEPGENSRVSNQPGVTHDANRVSIVTPEEQGSGNKEDSPLSFGEPPPRDEGGSNLPAVIDQPMFELIPDAAPELDLIDYVKAEWAKLSADHPRIANPRVWNDSRTKKIKSRAMDVVRAAPAPVSMFDVWDQIFAAIRGSEWLRGDSAPSKGYSESFVVYLDFVLRQSEFFKILEKAPIDAERNRTIPTVNGRQLSGSEQAAYRAIERQIARRKQQRS